ncbi:unnamed protein product [Echinostoma caproni]|uniref:Integrase catalytic domain-containing protein n=1 Tax=Echinostoma caproni TaxID=27848 RepID=A0A183AU67_9TREM|nr:unnamed protein product [Echinostoma caproni]
MLRRCSIALAAYNYDIQHRPGKTIPQADSLSRYSRFSEAEQCHFISPASPVSRESLRKSTKQYYSAILSAIKKGWLPEVKRKYPQFFAHRQELPVQLDGVLCRADRLVIPPRLRKTALEELHKGHVGVEKMKSSSPDVLVAGVGHRNLCNSQELREGIPQVLVSDNGSQFCATEMKLWIGSIRCQHLQTAPRHPCSNGAAENLVKTVKSAIASANLKTLHELEALVDNFLLQYRNATNTTTKDGPAMLFKSRRLRSSLQCLHSSDVVYILGNDLQPASGIVTRQLGQAMVEITDLNNATLHKRHVDQIHFKSSTDQRHQETSEGDS